jgi:hypothetical protein
MLQYTRLERLARVKHSSLLGPFVSYEENKVLVCEIAVWCVFHGRLKRIRKSTVLMTLCLYVVR